MIKPRGVQLSCQKEFWSPLPTLVLRKFAARGLRESNILQVHGSLFDSTICQRLLCQRWWCLCQAAQREPLLTSSNQTSLRHKVLFQNVNLLNHTPPSFLGKQTPDQETFTPLLASILPNQRNLEHKLSIFFKRR